MAVVTDQDTINALLEDVKESVAVQKNTITGNTDTGNCSKHDKSVTGKRHQSQSRHNVNSKSNSQKERKRPRDDYYGMYTNDRRDYHKKDEDVTAEDVKEEVIEKQKPNFGLSGALLSNQTSIIGRDGGMNSNGGSATTAPLYKGVVLKFQEPSDARTPNTQWRLYVFKGEEQIDTLHISRQSAYLFGRNSDIADIHIAHLSSSTQHAVLQYRAVPHKETGKVTVQPYLLDLESTNGSFINGIRIDPARYYQLKKGDVIKFGSSTREYVLIAA